MKSIFGVSLAMLLPISAWAEGGLPNQPYFYLTGKASIEKPADLVTVRFDLVARNADEAKANQDVQAKAAKVFALFKEKKIADKDVIAEDLRSEPEYEEAQPPSTQRGKLTGYTVTRVFAVKIRELATLGPTVDELIAMGGVEVSGIEGGLSNEKELRAQMSDKALANARERAEKTLKAAGMKIDSIFALSPIAFPEIAEKIFGGERFASANLVAPGQAPLEKSQYRPAAIEVSQSIHVIYLISQIK